MKKITALVALALLAIAGTGFAVTCAQDNVPAATLLVPYFRVGGTGVVGFNDIPDTSGTDTLVAVTNVSSAKIIIHVTLWNKYSAAVLDFNVPMTGYDVVFWSMRDILNGKLNVNPTFQVLTKPSSSSPSVYDPCGQVYGNGAAAGVTSFSTTGYIRFAPSSLDSDYTAAISVYNTPAFIGAFRQNVWTSLDESYDISNWLTPGAAGAGVLDVDNYACGSDSGSAVVGDFSGYVTIDVANYCTQHFPNNNSYWERDAIATVGWGGYPGANILMGDIFYKDQSAGTTTANIGNISGDPAVAIEFDSRLNWDTATTFYGRYYDSLDLGGTGTPYTFAGDGREPLGTNYGFRYLQTAAPSALRTWITVWRSDLYPNDNGVDKSAADLCNWWYYYGTADAVYGFTDLIHKISVKVWDNDENSIGGSGGPSGGPTGGTLYIYLETQRLVVTPNNLVVQPSFLGGWINLNLPGTTSDEQAYVGVQHSGLGLAMSVGHGATLLNGEFVCTPKPTVAFDPLTFPSGGASVGTGLAVQTGRTY